MTDFKRRGWIVVAGVAVVAAVILGPTVNTIGTFLISLSAEFHLTASQSSSLATAFLLGLQLASPLVGWLLDRMEARVVMAAGVVLVAVGYFWIGGSSTLTQLRWAFALSGIGVCASTYTPAGVISASWMGARIGLAFGLINSVSAVGAAASPVLVAHLLDGSGWRPVIQWVGAAMVLVAMPVIWLVVRTRPTDKVSMDSQPFSGPPGVGIKEALRGSVYWQMIFLIVVAGFGTTSIFYSIVSFLGQRGFSLQTASTIFAAGNLVTFVGFLAVGAAADRWGVHRILGAVLLTIVLSVAALLLAKPSAEGYIAAGLFTLLWGLASNGVMQLTPLLFVEHLGIRHFGTLFGSAGLLMGVASAAGPIFAGGVFDATGSYAIAFEICALAVGAGALPLLSLGRARHWKPVNENTA